MKINNIRHFPTQFHHAAKRHLTHLAKETERIIQRINQATLRFLLLTLPLHRFPIVRQLGKRAIKLGHPAIQIANHIDLSTKAGRAVAEFSVHPRAAFKLQPLDSKQIAKAIALKNSWQLEGHCQAKVKQFESLIQLSKKRWSTQQDFGRREWQAYDEINFELTREYLLNLASVFATPQFEKAQESLANSGVDLREAMIAEALSKALAYSEGNAGKEVQIPVQNRLVTYKISAIRFGKALPGYILEAPDAAPWIIARGTQTMLKKDSQGELRQGARESLLADLHPVSMTRDAVDRALEQSELQTLFANNKGIKLAGHSLGGALVNDLATRFPQQIQKVYTFSPPSMGPLEAKRWHPTLDDKLVAFDVLGDIVPIAGYHVKGLHLEISHKEKKHLAALHNEICLNKNFKASIIDNQKENQRKSRQRFAVLQRLQRRLLGIQPR